LTLKLTYAVVAPCSSRRSDLQGLSSRDRCLGRSQGYPAPVVSPAKDTHARTRRLGMLLEQNFAVTRQHARCGCACNGDRKVAATNAADACVVHCQPIQFSKSASPAPGRTARCVGATLRRPLRVAPTFRLALACNAGLKAGATFATENKKPGVERRVSPPHMLADARDARLSSSRYP